MPFVRSVLAALPFALLSPGQAALALTADELWADWQRLAKAGDVAITATTRREGDKLVLTDIAIPVGTPDKLADLRLERVDLQDRPDGTVAVLLPPQFPLTIDRREPGADVDLVRLTASAPGFSLVVAGIGEQAAFDLNAPSLTVSLAEVLPALKTDEAMDLNLAVADLAVRHSMDLTASTQKIASTVKLGTFHGDVRVDTAESQDNVRLSLDLSGVDGNLDAVFPPGLDRERLDQIDKEANPLPELLKALGDGFAVKSGLSFKGFALRSEMDAESGVTAVELTAESGQAGGRFDAEAAGYDITLGKTMLSGRNVPDVEFPEFAMGIGEFGYGLSVGIGDLVSPQDVRFYARLVDMTLPPEVWAKSDPSGLLGKEPLSYAVDVSGRYALGAEMLEPGWQPQPEAFPPMDIVEVTLNTLMFRGAGIAVDGSGSLTFDESDMVTYPGVPAPEGMVTVTATGVNALIDKLVETGLVSPDEVSGFRMGLMFIAKAGTEPDSLVSKVEFKDKSFFLNGMKMR